MSICSCCFPVFWHQCKCHLIALVLLFSGHRMVRLSVDDLVADAVEAFKSNECIEEPPEEQTIQVRRSALISS